MSSTVIPSLRYRDAKAAIAWLCTHFGFVPGMIVAGEGDRVAHAQLVLGGGMIMVGSADNGSDFGNHVRHPDEVGGFETQCPYLVVQDADKVYASVKAAGGLIVTDIKDEDYGGRGFACRDLEGHLWYVGTYNPWKSGT
ncbi:MAG: VOC family protein [Ramlibacter sp.]